MADAVVRQGDGARQGDGGHDGNPGRRRLVGVAVAILVHVAILWPLLLERGEPRNTLREAVLYLVPTTPLPHADDRPKTLLSAALPPELLVRVPLPMAITLAPAEEPRIGAAPPAAAAEADPFDPCPPLPPGSKAPPKPGCQVLIIPGGLHFDFASGKLIENPPLAMEPQTPAQRDAQHKAALAKLNKLFGPKKGPPPLPTSEQDRAGEFSTDQWQKQMRWADDNLGEKAPLIQKLEDMLGQ